MADHDFNSSWAQAQNEWLQLVQAMECELNADTLRRLSDAAALVMRVAQADKRANARVVEQWLSSLGVAACMGGAVLAQVPSEGQA